MSSFFSSLFGSKNQDEIVHTLRFGRFGTYGVKTEWTENPSSQKLIASLILYMSMYFYAGENRVVAAAAKSTLDHLIGNQDPDDLTKTIYDAIRNVFNPAEKNALDGTFEHGKPFQLDSFDSFEKKDHIIKTISTKSLRLNEQWVATISVGLGLDAVVLPLGIGILYNYIWQKLDDGERSQLKLSTIDICCSWSEGNCKKLQDSRIAANSVINKFLVI